MKENMAIIKGLTCGHHERLAIEIEAAG